MFFWRKSTFKLKFSTSQDLTIGHNFLTIMTNCVGSSKVRVCKLAMMYVILMGFKVKIGVDWPSFNNSRSYHVNQLNSLLTHFVWLLCYYDRQGLQSCSM